MKNQKELKIDVILIPALIAGRFFYILISVTV